MAGTFSCLRSTLFLYALLGMCLFTSISSHGAPALQSELDVSVRYDDRSSKPSREQYRVRWYPSASFDDSWSVHLFAVTGDEFSSSYNTFGETGHFHLRRVYLRYQTGDEKTEVGVIPTYKGRVSSTGLSKDGWITGIRKVTSVGKSALLEVVAGSLDHLNDPNSLQSLDDPNYFELEWSQQLDEQWSFELGLEHMLSNNFVRNELRYENELYGEYVFEVIHRFDNQRFKVNLSTENTFAVNDYQIDWFALYSYVNDDFGLRAELTEDFLDTGHAMMLELEGPLYDKYGLEWFAKGELYEGQSRFQLGVKFSL